MIAVLVVATACAIFAAGWFARFALAIAVLDDLRRSGHSWLTALTPAPRESLVVLEAATFRFDADLYRPRSGGLAPLMLVPGAVEQGKNDPRVAPFARTLARAGFTVVVPDLPSMKSLRLDSDNLREVVAAHGALCRRRDLAPHGSAALFGISYAGGLAILAALDPERSAHVPFVATVGAFADLDTVLRFLVTGVVHDRAGPRTVPVDPYGRMVFVRTYETFMSDAADVRGLEAIIERRTRDPAAGIGDLVAGLGPEGRQVVDLFESPDHGEIDRRIAALPIGLRRRMAMLSPARSDFSTLRARLYLVHAHDDGTFPATESDRVAELARPHVDVHAMRLDVLQHVAFGPIGRDPWKFITRELPEAVEIVAWWAALLDER